MTAFKALFVGLTTIDIQYLVEEFPKPNTKVKASNPEIFIGGPAANAAVAFSRLNGEAHLVSAIGKNAFSDQIYDDFQKKRSYVYRFVGGGGFYACNCNCNNFK